MKIFPRFIDLPEGKDTASVSVKNSTNDKFLFFKVRREEEKVLDFSPLHGFVQPGSVGQISIRLLQKNFQSSKLLVKLVATDLDVDPNDFSASWKKGEANGEVKKLITVQSVKQKPISGNSSSLLSSLDKQSKFSHSQALKDNLMVQSSEIFSEASSLHFAPHGGPNSPSNFSQSMDFSETSGITFDHMIKPESGALNQLQRSDSPILEESKNSERAAGNQHELSEDNLAMLDLLAKLDQRTHARDLHLQGAEQYQDALDRSRSESFISESIANSITAGVSRGISVGVEMGLSNIMSASAAATGPAGQGALAQHYDSAGIAARAMSGSFESKEEYHDARPSTQRPPPRQAVVKPLPAAQQQRGWGEAAAMRGFQPIKQAVNQGMQQDLCRELSKFTFLGSPQLKPDGSVDGSVSQSVVLEIIGSTAVNPLITDSTVTDIIEARIEEANHSRLRTIAVEITNCKFVTALRTTLSAVFLHGVPKDRNLTSGAVDGSDIAAETVEQKLHKLYSMFFEDNLRQLSVNECSLKSVDVSINRFHQLTSLNLSGNMIRTIEGPLDLPLLQTLDISNNFLKSLDFLQLLLGLKTLQAAGNRISSLLLSVNMLVTLSSNLTVLDLSDNPVCQDQRYALEVIHVLPYLRRFDTVDLDPLRQDSYSYNASLRSSTAQSGTPRRAGTPTKALPQLPHEARSISTSRTGGPAPSELETKIRRAFGLVRKQQERMRGGGSPVPVNSETTQQAANQSAYFLQRQQEGEYPEYIEEQQVEYDPEFEYQRDNQFRQAPQATIVHQRVSTPQKQRQQPSERYADVDRQDESPPHSRQQPAVDNMFRSGPTPGSAASTMTGPKFAGPTLSSRVRRKSEVVTMIPHWAGHSEPQRKHAATPTKQSLRRRSVGGTMVHRDISEISANMPFATFDLGYRSDGDISFERRDRCNRNHALKVSERMFMEMQEDEKYSIWHPRYRVPIQNYGFSKPFAHRPDPHMHPDKAPLYQETIQRIRDGYSKLPTRGTFTRAAKGLTSEWYKMDKETLDIIRREGYFHQTIGSTMRFSKDENESSLPKGSTIQVGKSGSVTISPSKPGRRASQGPHMSKTQLEMSQSVDKSFSDVPGHNNSNYGDTFASDPNLSENFTVSSRPSSNRFEQLQQQQAQQQPPTQGAQTIRPSFAASKLFEPVADTPGSVMNPNRGFAVDVSAPAVGGNYDNFYSSDTSGAPTPSTAHPSNMLFPQAAAATNIQQQQQQKATNILSSDEPGPREEAELYSYFNYLDKMNHRQS